MGTLIAVKYPTKLFLKLFDHTYVMCGTGRVRWPCWGGSSGGTAFRSATGSTMRAALIAGADGRAGIACYLVNGVCHQAANRILSAGEATVRGVRAVVRRRRHVRVAVRAAPRGHGRSSRLHSRARRGMGAGGRETFRRPGRKRRHDRWRCGP